MSSYDDKLKNFRGGLRRWEKIRHPWGGALRIALLAAFPFVVWSHNPLESILWVIIALFHVPFFPAYVVAGEEAPLLTRLTDAVQYWYEMTPADERIVDLFPAAVMVLPMFCSFWMHVSFWGTYFYVATILCSWFFLRRQLQLTHQRQEDKISQMEHIDPEHTEQEEEEHA